MAQQFDIPKTVSRSEGPGPSLLTLSPELRNMIYDYLLIQPHPINIRRLEYTRSNLTAGSSKPYSSGTASILGILETCRTVYHEAVGIFYARNTFAYEMFGNKYRMFNPALHVAHFVVRWSSRFHYLHDVTIKWGDFPGFGEYDLALLVMICWARRDQKCIFSLISPIDAAQKKETNTLTRLLNATLRQLVADTLGIRKYQRQILSITMDHVFRGDFPSQICIWFGSNRSHRRSDANWEMKFHSKDECKTFELYEEYQRPNLVCLPLGIKELIFKKVMCSSPIDVNVDDMKPTSPDIPLLFVCKHITAIAKSIFWSQNSFTYRTILEPPLFDKKTSQRRLQAVLCTKKTGLHLDSHRLWPNASHHVSKSGHQNITVEFNFEYDHAMTLADVRIDAKHLIRITSHLDGRKCFVRFKVSSTVDGVTKTEENTVSLRHIRARILELLSQAVSTTHRIVNSVVFDFNIDGNGNAGRLKYTIKRDSKSIFGSEEYKQLPSIEAVEAHYGVLSQEHWQGNDAPRVNGSSALRFVGKLSTYLGYLQVVAKKSPEMRRFSDDFFARDWFFTREW
ncbi:hypothetical protein P3342_013280 [Pyrenophora teres f. teres]|nr:hypothetical protein P3342_013280 [Pyrenophora teres f. teres]